MNLSELNFDFNKVILAPEFEQTLKEISQINITLPNITFDASSRIEDLIYSSGKIQSLGEIEKKGLRAELGQKQLNNSYNIAAYDESIIKFVSLEGTAYFTSHSLVLLTQMEYVPVTYITFYFYTKSKEIVNKSKYIRYSENPEIDSKKDYIKDRINFLQTVVPKNTILFIDGPLIAGDVFTYVIAANEEFIKKGIMQMYFVKNSSSNLVTDNVPELVNKFNSDLHWSYVYLKSGERTNYFQYHDLVNPKNAKIFCYLKAFELSPERIECDINTYECLKDQMDDIMDMVYYFLNVQGDFSNPQIRPIAIAEKYARETLKLVNIERLIKEIGIIPTMNQVRFGG